MLLKFIIVILLIGLIISLGSGLVFLFKDVGSTRRTLNSLGVRIALATALMATTVYGFYSGQLEVGAPWDAAGLSRGTHPVVGRGRASTSRGGATVPVS